MFTNAIYLHMVKLVIGHKQLCIMKTECNKPQTDALNKLFSIEKSCCKQFGEVEHVALLK